MNKLPKFQERTFQKIVWIQTAFLGDIVLTTAAMGLAKSTWSAVRQELITTPVGKKTLQDSPLLDRILSLDKANTSLWYQINLVRKWINEDPDTKNSTLLLVPHRSLRSGLLACVTGLPWIGYEESALSFLAKERVARIAVFHEAHRIAMLLEPLGIKREEILKSKPSLNREPTELANSHGKKLIGIAAGSKWGTKRWPENYYMQLIENLLHSHPELTFVLLGDKEEKSNLHALTALAKSNPSVINLMGETNLAQFAAVVAKLDTLVTNDSSPTHFASAYNIPTLAIFGATTPSMGFGPLANKHAIVEHPNMPCRPCSDHGPKTCPLHHFKCMKEITPQVVASKMLHLLDLSLH